MKELNKLKTLEATILKAIAQTKASKQFNTCDFTKAILDNLRTALMRCQQSQEALREKLIEDINAK